MSNEQVQFLNLRHLPGRFTVQQTAWYLGFTAEDIPKLTKARLLKPEGDPGAKATKVYAYANLKRRHDSAPWMHKASANVYKENREKHKKTTSSRKRLR